MVVVCTWEILHNRELLENSSFLQVFKGDNDNWRWRRQPWRIRRRWIVGVVPVLIRVNILTNTRSSFSSLHSFLKNLRVSRSGRENATRMAVELYYCFSSVKYITLHASTYTERRRRRRNSPHCHRRSQKKERKAVCWMINLQSELQFAQCNEIIFSRLFVAPFHSFTSFGTTIAL